MAETPSNPFLRVGQTAPNFTLPVINQGQLDPTYSTVDLNFLYKNKNPQGVIVAFICNHCPYVKHIADRLSEVAKELVGQKVYTLAISSNDAEKYPEDAPEKMVEEANFRDYRFPYLYDQSQEIAVNYKASCTPEFFLLDREQKIFYHGQFDNSRPGNDLPVTGKDLYNATQSLISGENPPESQVPSLGCNIKWIPGNEPDYYSVG